MITVMGATGHTGKKITQALLKAGEKVRALGRTESKLAEPKCRSRSPCRRHERCGVPDEGLSRRRCRLHSTAY